MVSYQYPHLLVCVPQSDDPDISRSMEDSIGLIPVQNQTSSCKFEWKEEEANCVHLLAKSRQFKYKTPFAHTDSLCGSLHIALHDPWVCTTLHMLAHIHTRTHARTQHSTDQAMCTSNILRFCTHSTEHKPPLGQAQQHGVSCTYTLAHVACL